VTARRPEALERAAARGWPIFLGTGQHGDDTRLLAQLAAFEDGLAAAGHGPAVLEECRKWSCYDVMNVVVAESDEAAQAQAQQARAERDAFRELVEARNARLAHAVPIREELGERPAGPGAGRARGEGAVAGL